MLLCLQRTIGNDTPVFTLREINVLFAERSSVPEHGDRLCNCSNYYVAARELEGTACQMSTGRTQDV